MTLWTILQAGCKLGCSCSCSCSRTRRTSLGAQGLLLFVNGCAILNNERFLKPCAPTGRLPARPVPPADTRVRGAQTALALSSSAGRT